MHACIHLSSPMKAQNTPEDSLKAWATFLPWSPNSNQLGLQEWLIISVHDSTRK